MNAMCVIRHELDNCENEILGFVEGVKNLVSGDCDCACARGSSFDLDETKLPAVFIVALDVITQFLLFTIHRKESETALHIHYDSPRTGG